MFQGRGAREAGRASEKVDSLSGKIDTLNTDLRAALVELERLGLAHKALWDLAAAKLGLTEEDLLKRVQELRSTPELTRDESPKEAVMCQACGRPLNRGRNACIYCGADNTENLIMQVVKSRGTGGVTD